MKLFVVLALLGIGLMMDRDYGTAANGYAPPPASATP